VFIGGYKISSATPNPASSDAGGHNSVARSQELSHGEGHDYVVGSPHLRHLPLNIVVRQMIADAVREIVARQGTCEVLEIGAGHGVFTETVVGAGGTATVTEMSKPSCDFLSEKFRDTAGVRVLYDPDGNAALRDGALYDVLLFISVIHHIPDYLGSITSLCGSVLRPGGTVVTFQDPLWYPRQTRKARTLSQVSYFAWRVTQGEFRRGLKSRWRRLRGVYDENEPSDLVEYHVVRDGVDEERLERLFREHFSQVEIKRYFSTQSPLFQRLGDKHFPPNTFGIVASGHRVQ